MEYGLQIEPAYGFTYEEALEAEPRNNTDIRLHGV